ncbi:hypothetical protein, partial [Mesorhizobium sp.]|uniref:hypothetical protein n=1 Tax=Mesorhizobium sp. TaxID=1871066 RepID=UPI0025E4F27F
GDPLPDCRHDGFDERSGIRRLQVGRVHLYFPVDQYSFAELYPIVSGKAMRCAGTEAQTERMMDKSFNGWLNGFIG